jgi:ABC-type sulfate transport system permease component
MVVQQTIIFACSAVFFKTLIGLVTAHLINNLPSKGQRKWRGMLLVPWVIPLALSSLSWWWLFDPTHSALNWIATGLGFREIPWLSDPHWARFSVIIVNVWYGAPFFLIMYLAALKSVPEQLYEAAAVDGANAWQKFRYVTAHDAQHHRHYGVVLAHRDLRQFRHRADHDRGRAAQHDARVRDLCFHARHPFGRSAAWRRRIAFHVSNSRDRRDFHSAWGA